METSLRHASISYRRYGLQHNRSPCSLPSRPGRRWSGVVAGAVFHQFGEGPEPIRVGGDPAVVLIPHVPHTVLPFCVPLFGTRVVPALRQAVSLSYDLG